MRKAKKSLSQHPRQTKKEVRSEKLAKRLFVFILIVANAFPFTYVLAPSESLKTEEQV